MKRVLLTLALIVVVLATVTLERTASFRSRQPQVIPVAVEPLDTAALARRLAGALRFKTVSFQDSSQFDAREFEGLHRYLRDSFPKLHAALKLEKVNGYGLLYEWTGSDPGLAQRPPRIRAGRRRRARHGPDHGRRRAGGAHWDRGEGICHRGADRAGRRRALLDAAQRDGGGHPRRRARPARSTADAAGHPRPHGGHVRLPRSRDAVRAPSGD